MRRIQIKKALQRSGRQRPRTQEPLSLDPRDPDICRVKQAQRQIRNSTAPQQRKENTHAAS